MNTIFSINRLCMLLKRYFIENRQRELTFWGGAILLFAWFPFSENNQTSFFILLIFISGFIFAGRMFKIFNYTSGGMHYLLIPATHLEKLITAIILSTFYFVIMIVITFVIGRTLDTTIGNLYTGTHQPVYYELIQSTSKYSVYKQSGLTLFNMFFLFAAFQSVFLLGSIYFKGNAFGKTTLVIFIVSILLLIISNLLANLLLCLCGPDHQLIFTSLTIHNIFSANSIFQTIIMYAFIPFFWLVSYFRLTEKQV